MNKFDNYVIYIILAFSLVINIMFGVRIQSLSNNMEQMQETQQKAMKLIQYNKQDIELLEHYVDNEFGYKLIDTTKLDEVVEDTAAIE